jgi:tetratricopeptide (TPR) repeat protein
MRRQIMKTAQQMFNPSVEKFEILKEMIIERTDELSSILGRLESTSIKGTSRNYIVIGPRGIGKTHFLLIIYYEIKEQENLKDKYLALKFSEEEYSIDSLAYFFIRILEELLKESTSSEDEMEIKDFLETSTNLDNKELIRKADRFLEEYFEKHQRKIILFADNIDEIFRKISSSKDTDLRHLRAILQSKDYLLIIGATPTYFKEIRNHNEPFYSFFEIIRLAPLSEEGVEKLILKLAELEDDPHIIDEFASLRPRIRTIVHFTGGVPRLVRMLYYVIANSEMIEVADSLEKLLDELTPYYQARMAQLSPQQQKIIDIMALLDGPSSPTKIARFGRMERPTVNAQIQKLEELGFVNLVKQKRRKWRRYDITERMFRIWREMRKSKSGNRVKYLADFLKAFYTKAEFKQHIIKIDEKISSHMQCEMNSEIQRYVREFELIKEVVPRRMLPDLECRLIEKYIQIDELKKAEIELNFVKKLLEKERVTKEINEKLFKLEMKKIDKSLDKDPEDVSNRIKKARLLFQRKRFEDAMTELDIILKINPRHIDALIIHGAIFIILEKFDKAILEFEKALKIKPRNKSAMLLRASTFVFSKQYERAIQEFEKFLKIHPKNEGALNFLGYARFKQKKYKRSLKDFNKVLEINSKNEDAIIMKGRAIGSLGKTEDALKEFKHVLKLNPKNEEAQYWKGYAIFDLGQYSNAIEEFDKVLKLNPKNEDALLMKAKALGHLGKDKEALRETEKVLKINPKDEEAQYLKAIAFFNTGRFKMAIKEFNKVNKLNPKNEDALLMKGRALGCLKKNKEAQREFEKMLKINSKNEEAQYWRAFALFHQKKYKIAIKGFEKTIKANQKDENALLMKGRALGSLNKHKEALNEFEKVLKINPNNESAQFWKAFAFYHLEQYRKAAKEFEKVIKQNPKDDIAVFLRACSILNLEKYEEAIKEFGRALKINPKNEDARHVKAISFSHLGFYGKAIKELETILNNNPKNEDALKHLGIYLLLDNKHKSFFTWFENLEHSRRQFSFVFTEDWEFEYDFERKNALRFLRGTLSYRGQSEDFRKFWKDLLNFTVNQILHFSAVDFKSRNFGKASEKLYPLFESKNLWKEGDVYSLFLEYFIDIVRIDINHAEEIFDLFKEESDEDFRGTFSTLDKTIAYLKSKDSEMLEKMFPEEREVVEKLIERVVEKSER